MSEREKALVWVRFESKRAAAPGQRGEAVWSPAMLCRLESVDFQPGPEWSVFVVVERKIDDGAPLWRIPLRKDGILPAGVVVEPGQTVRIEYENVGKAAGVLRATLWFEPKVADVTFREPFMLGLKAPRLGDFSNLEHGLYVVRWLEGGGSSLAAVGSDASGQRWYAPTNWISGPSFDWSKVRSVELILSTRDWQNMRDSL